MAFGVVFHGVFAASCGRRRKDCHGSWHSRSFFERGRSPLRKWSGRSECASEVTARSGTTDLHENRELGSVSVRRSEVAEVVGRQPDPEKRLSARCVKIAKRTTGGDGDLARGNLGQRESGARGAAGEGAPSAGPKRKHHVTASGTGDDPRACVGVPRRWKAPWVERIVSSSRRGEEGGLGEPIRAQERKLVRESRERQGCQRYG